MSPLDPLPPPSCRPWCRALIKQLFLLPLPWNCRHGRSSHLHGQFWNVSQVPLTMFKLEWLTISMFAWYVKGLCLLDVVVLVRAGFIKIDTLRIATVKLMTSLLMSPYFVSKPRFGLWYSPLGVYSRKRVCILFHIPSFFCSVPTIGSSEMFTHTLQSRNISFVLQFTALTYFVDVVGADPTDAALLYVRAKVCFMKTFCMSS